MSVSFTEVLEVKNSLLQQFITVSDEWIEACIEFLKQEQDSPLHNLKKSVYQQWLLADLEEIASPSLPPQLPTQQKITLQNNFALQVQGIRDVSRPAYSQLKQLEGTENSNADYSSAPPTSVPEWEAKPTRMLMLNLTDGCIQVQGMEYRAISCLSPNLHPGIKVLIRGPVECRLGVLLLQPENIRILGGEVESKLLTFSRENVLKMQLQIPISDENVEESPADNPSTISNGSESANRLSSRADTFYPNNRNLSALNQNARNDFQSSNFGSNNTAGRDIPRFVRNSPQAVPPEEIVLEDDDTPDLMDNFGNDDDFERNLDYEKIDEIESTQRQNNESSILNPNQEDPNIWEEDEDVVREMMEFQDRDLAFEMPLEADLGSGLESKPPVFTYLSSVSNMSSSESFITIKGFIIKVLSKLECTPSTGWNLIVKINDGTASIDASIHDKVLENIIGVSAQDMLKKKTLAVRDPNIKAEVLEAISKCKTTLQNLNCLMDIQFRPGEKPSITKFSEVSYTQLQQMIQSTSHSF